MDFHFYLLTSNYENKTHSHVTVLHIKDLDGAKFIYRDINQSKANIRCSYFNFSSLIIAYSMYMDYVMDGQSHLWRFVADCLKPFLHYDFFALLLHIFLW